MRLKCLVFFGLLGLCLLAPHSLGSENSDESDDSAEVTTMRAMVQAEMAKSTGAMVNRVEANPPESAKKSAPSKDKEEEEEEDEDEDEEDEEEGEKTNSTSVDDDDEETCDTRLSTFVRSFNSTPYMPDTYEQEYDKVAKTDFVNKKYNITDMMTAVQRMIDNAMKLSGNKDLTDTAMYLSSVMMDRIYEAKVSAECTADLANIGQSLRNYEIWPAKFVDSLAALIPTGLLRGHISSYGEYDQCIRIKSPKLENGRTIYGKYCQIQARSIIPNVDIHTPETEKMLRANKYIDQVITWMGQNMNLDKILDDGEVVRILKELLNWVDSGSCFWHIGICLPSSCSPPEIETLINQLVFPIIQIPFRVQYCDTHEEIADKKLHSVQWFAIICLSTMAGIILLATLYHIYLILVKDRKTMNEIALPKDVNGNDKDGMKGHALNLCLRLEEPKAGLRPARSVCQQFVLAFSVVENTNRLRAADKRYAPLHGLQLLLTFLIFTSQSFTFPVLFTPQLLRSIIDTVPYKIVTSNSYWFVRTPSLWIDGFVFVLGVFIVSTQFKRLRATHDNFDIFEYIWKKWFRLSGAIFGSIMLLFLLPLTGNGPMWYINTNWMFPACTSGSSLMSTFLYYSNWNPTFNNYTIENKFNICNPPTWFFSASMQLYLVAPLIFIPLYRWPRMGVSMAVLLLLLSPLSTLSARLLTGLPTFFEFTSFPNFTLLYQSYHQYHANTFQYVTPLIIGLLTGYMIERKPKMKLGGQAMEVIFFLFSAASIVATILWNNTFWKFNQELSEYSTLGWVVSSKFMFSGAIAYITYMCCTGRFEYLSQVLAVPFLQPVARLSYGIFMLSALTILFRTTGARHTYEMYMSQTLQNTVVDFVITIVLAYGMYLLFEGPCTALIEVFESDQLFKGLENTDSVEELKQSDSSGNTSDSEKSNGDKKKSAILHKDFA